MQSKGNSQDDRLLGDRERVPREGRMNDDQIKTAYANGARFMVMSENGMSKTRETFASRGEMEKYRKEHQHRGGRLEVFYILSDGTLRSCSRGKRLK